ncbi:MAG: MCE family protein [Nitrospirae bacterium]|nr:MAG: MCE family protein [Nitrospirota bacterium]
MPMHYSHKLSGPRMAQLVGAFVLVPVLGLIAVGIFMLKAEHIFDEKYQLHATLSNAYGLAPGDPVVISGLPIGRVRTVEFADGGTVAVTFQLLSRYQEMVRENSVASITKSGVVMGQSQVEVAMGDQRKPVLTDGSTIRVQPPTDYAAMLNEVRSEVKPVLESVQRTVLRVEEITKDVQQAVQTGGRTLAHVEQATRELPAVMASVQHSVTAVEQTTATLPELTGSVKKTLGKVDGIVTDVKATTAKLPPLVAAAQDAVNNIKASTESIKAVSKDMPPLVRTAHATLDDVNTIIKGAKRTFPVSTMVRNAEQMESVGRAGNGLTSLRGDQLPR